MGLGDLGADTVGGTGLAITLAGLLVHLLRRQGDTDSRRDAISDWLTSERDRAWAEATRVRTECNEALTRERQHREEEVKFWQSEVRHLRSLIEDQRDSSP